MLGVPSYYGGSLFIQLAAPKQMEELTVRYLKRALFETGGFELAAGGEFNDQYRDWTEPENLNRARTFEPNLGWFFDGQAEAEGISWGGCLESLDDLLRHGIEIPSLDEFERIILLTETSEELPSSGYVTRVFRALGQLGILERVQGVLVGRPQAWNHEQPLQTEAKERYKQTQRQAILETVRKYNASVPVVQNLDFGHTNPQIAMPYGRRIRILCRTKQILAEY